MSKKSHTKEQLEFYKKSYLETLEGSIEGSVVNVDPAARKLMEQSQNTLIDLIDQELQKQPNDNNLQQELKKEKKELEKMQGAGIEKEFFKEKMGEDLASKRKLQEKLVAVIDVRLNDGNLKAEHKQKLEKEQQNEKDELKQIQKKEKSTQQEFQKAVATLVPLDKKTPEKKTSLKNQGAKKVTNEQLRETVTMIVNKAKSAAKTVSKSMSKITKGNDKGR